MKLLIIRGNQENAKSYPYWDEFLELVKDHEVKEVKGILHETELIDLINWSDVWISIDSFIQHLVKYYKLKKGIVIWGKSDPERFGYSENINLLKDREYLRSDQYVWWKDVPWDKDAFVSPETLLNTLDVL